MQKYYREYYNRRRLYKVTCWFWYAGGTFRSYKTGELVTVEREPYWFSRTRGYGPWISCIDNDWYYTFHTGRYAWFRRIKTYPEMRENDQFDKYDEDRKFYKIKVRRARCKKCLPTSWDDVQTSRIGGKSWKDYTKKRKQWMINLD